MTTPEGLMETTNGVVSFSVGMGFSMNTSYTYKKTFYRHDFTKM